MTVDKIKEIVNQIVDKYPISRIILFGSRAAGINSNDSDIDLIIEFKEAISLFTIAKIKIELEEISGLEVDIIHGPIQETDMIEIGKTVELYAA